MPRVTSQRAWEGEEVDLLKKVYGWVMTVSPTHSAYGIDDLITSTSSMIHLLRQ
jgi:hypothetical protein